MLCHISNNNFPVFSCGTTGLETPVNGSLSLTQTTLGSVASFACNAGFVLIGNATRTCELTGWSGSDPSCRKLENPFLNHHFDEMFQISVMCFMFSALIRV